tara:strand:- start:387 stop:1082 length:696 start_codon:yes stop_codon:yes gene_type:complete
MNYKPQKKLLSFANYKMQKSIKFGYASAILHLAPYNLSGVNICPMASKGCIKSCLNTAGRGQMTTVQKSRINKTRYFLKDRAKFLIHLNNEIRRYSKKAIKDGLKLNIRLNGTSDLPFERYKLINGLNLMENNPDVIFHDYTKIKNRCIQELPDNYKLTFSKSESNDDDVKDLLKTNTNIAVVFKKLPKTYLGRKVVDGDISDLRFKDPKGVIVGLIAKGKAKKDLSGFVI